MLGVLPQLCLLFGVTFDLGQLAGQSVDLRLRLRADTGSRCRRFGARLFQLFTQGIHFFGSLFHVFICKILGQLWKVRFQIVQLALGGYRAGDALVLLIGQLVSALLLPFDSLLQFPQTHVLCCCPLRHRFALRLWKR